MKTRNYWIATLLAAFCVGYSSPSLSQRQQQYIPHQYIPQHNGGNCPPQTLGAYSEGKQAPEEIVTCPPEPRFTPCGDNGLYADGTGTCCSPVQTNPPSCQPSPSVQQQQQAEERLAKQQKLAKETQDAKKNDLQDKLINDYSVQQFTNQQVLQANVFVYQNLVVGVPTRFDQMTSPTEALFGQLVVSKLPQQYCQPIPGAAPADPKCTIRGVAARFDQKTSATAPSGQLVVSEVPKDKFTHSGQTVILVLKILGLKQTQILGTSLNLPYGSYVGVYECITENCTDFF
jgi:hypothetical protein